MLDAMLEAAARDDARAVLTAIAFHSTGGYSATDSYRLAWYGDISGEASPVAITSELRKAAARVKRNDSVHWGITADGAVRLEFPYVGGQVKGSPVVASRVMDSRYPNVSQLIPAGNAGTITLLDYTREAINKRADAARAAKRYGYTPPKEDILEVASKVSRALGTPGMVIDTNTGEIHLAGGDAGIWTARLAIKCSGDVPRKVAFNPSFLLSAILHGGNVLELRDALKPAIFGGDVRHLLMPVRVD